MDQENELDISFGDDEFGVANSTFDSVVLNETIDSSFDAESDPDNPSEVSFASTPVKSSQVKFKKPKLPPPKYFKKCAQCGNYLKTERGFAGHMQNHRWKDAAALRPPVDEILVICKEKVPKLLESIMLELNASEGQPGHLLAVQAKSALGDMKANVENSDFLAVALNFIRGILSEKAGSKAMPSALRTVFQFELSASYKNTEFLKTLKDTFNALTTTVDALAWNVIYIFLQKFMDLAFVTFCEKIRGPVFEEARVASKDDFNHHLSQQVVHYVSGACMRCHLRNAYKHPKNTYMQNVKQCILDNFATIGHPAVTDRKNSKYWTSLLNRKSLLFVNDSALPFFIALSKLLQRLESTDGSLNHEKVMSDVVATPALRTLWDSIVNNSLSDEHSFRFMTQVVRSLTNCFGKGVMLRKMNAKAKNSQGNKSALAPSMRARLLGK